MASKILPRSDLTERSSNAGDPRKCSLRLAFRIPAENDTDDSLFRGYVSTLPSSKGTKDQLLIGHVSRPTFRRAKFITLPHDRFGKDRPRHYLLCTILRSAQSRSPQCNKGKGEARAEQNNANDDNARRELRFHEKIHQEKAVTTTKPMLDHSCNLPNRRDVITWDAVEEVAASSRG